VTGQQTVMDTDLTRYLERCRRATDLPLAVGFGISRQEDVAMLEGKAHMAVIGTATIRLVDQLGPDAVVRSSKGCFPGNSPLHNHPVQALPGLSRMQGLYRLHKVFQV